MMKANFRVVYFVEFDFILDVMPLLATRKIRVIFLIEITAMLFPVISHLKKTDHHFCKYFACRFDEGNKCLN